MAITSLLELTLRPDAVDGAHAVIHETLKATRAFDGCRGVDVLADQADPTHLVLVEQWESLEHDDAYRAWRATPDGASGLAQIVAAPPRLTRCTLADGV